MNAITFEDTLTASSVHSASSTENNLKVNGSVQTSSASSSLKSMRLAAHGVLGLLMRRMICFTIDAKPTQSSEVFRASTCFSPTRGIAPLNWVRYSSPAQYVRALTRVNATTNNSPHSTITSFVK